MFKNRAAFLAIPASIALIALTATAQAGTVALVPLNPLAAHSDIVAGAAACTNPQAPATLTEGFADFPSISRVRDDSGQVEVGVTLASTGTPQKAWVVRSSGISALDSAAIQTAYTSKYSPERHNCDAVSGDYIIEVEFEK
jgi:TonB family protein